MHTDILSTHTHTYTWLYSPFMRLTWWRLLFLQLDCWYFPFHFCWLFTFCSLTHTHTHSFSIGHGFRVHFPSISLALTRSLKLFANMICVSKYVLFPTTTARTKYAMFCFYSGYGNIVPVTTSGRSFCMMFALIGIPFTLTGPVQLKLFLTHLLIK